MSENHKLVSYISVKICSHNGQIQGGGGTFSKSTPKVPKTTISGALFSLLTIKLIQGQKTVRNAVWNARVNFEGK